MRGHSSFNNAQSKGFTIVELLIVVVVIAILAAITIVAFRGIQDQAKASALKSDLTNAAKALELAKIQSGTDTYPTGFPSSVKTSNGAILSLSEETNAYCVNAELPGSTLKHFYSLTSKTIETGVCPGNIVSGSEIGTTPTLINDVTFSALGSGAQQWGIGIGGSASATASVRAGTASDPFPNRPVLRVSNTANSATTWLYIRGPVNLAGITSGSTYSSSFYVRLASGTVGGAIYSFGVMSGSATNASLAQASGAITPTSDWRQAQRSGIVAAQNGVTGTALYQSLNIGDAKTNNFVLEFQGFELRLAN